MFKKPILFFSIILGLSHSAFAGYMFNNTFYVRGDILASKFWNTRYQDAFRSFKIKSKESIGLDFGVGYNSFSGLRSELVFTHLFPVKYVSPNNEGKAMDARGNALILRGAYDIYEFEPFKLFVGGGLGVSRIKTQAGNDWYYTDNGGVVRTIPKPASKYKYNPAYNALIGISFDMGPQNVLELGYQFADYGKTAGLKVAPHIGKYAMRSHNIFFGFRYEF